MTPEIGIINANARKTICVQGRVDVVVRGGVAIFYTDCPKTRRDIAIVTEMRLADLRSDSGGNVYLYNEKTRTSKRVNKVNFQTHHMPKIRVFEPAKEKKHPHRFINPYRAKNGFIRF